MFSHIRKNGGKNPAISTVGILNLNNKTRTARLHSLQRGWTSACSQIETEHQSGLSNSSLSHLCSLQSSSHTKQLWVKVEESGCDKCSTALFWDQHEEFIFDLRSFYEGEWHSQGLSWLRIMPTDMDRRGCRRKAPTRLVQFHKKK